MSIASTGAGAPEGDPYAPATLLTECHRRVHDQCATLTRLAEHLVQHGSDAAAGEAARAVLRYFDLAAPLHHADEEKDLFPALLASAAGSDPVCLEALVLALRDEHLSLASQWQALRDPLLAVAAGRPARLDAQRVRAFGQAYAAHIAREEDELLPMAARLLSDESLQRISRAMRRRRGLAA